jgi:hypothetical protein
MEDLTPENIILDWWRYDSAQRPWAFLEYAEELLCIYGHDAAPAIWAALKAEWSSFDAINHDAFGRLMRELRPAWTPDAAWLALPPRMTVWRGQDWYHRPTLAWTTDRAVAERFAYGLRFRNANPALLEATIRREAVAMLLLDREEAEVVLFRRIGRFKATPVLFLPEFE